MMHFSIYYIFKWTSLGKIEFRLLLIELLYILERSRGNLFGWQLAFTIRPGIELKNSWASKSYPFPPPLFSLLPNFLLIPLDWRNRSGIEHNFWPCKSFFSPRSAGKQNRIYKMNKFHTIEEREQIDSWRKKKRKGKKKSFYHSIFIEFLGPGSGETRETYR